MLGEISLSVTIFYTYGKELLHNPKPTFENILSNHFCLVGIKIYENHKYIAVSMYLHSKNFGGYFWVSLSKMDEPNHWVMN